MGNNETRMSAWSPSRLVGGVAATDAQRWRILDDLYDPKGTVFGSLGVLLVGFYGFATTRSPTFLVWIASTIAMLLVRFACSVAYRRRSAQATPERWSRVFFVAVTASGFQLGLGALFVAPESSELVGVVLGLTTGILAAGAARIYPHPFAAIAHAGVATTVVCGTYAVSGRWIEISILLLYFVFQVSIVQSLGALRSTQMASERQTAALVAELERMTLTDPLTGVANRRRFEHAFGAAWDAAREKGTPISVLLFDLDHFKSLNDGYGHQAGDDVLSIVASTAQSILPAGGVLARYGGEEFAVVLPDTSVEVAGVVGEAIVRGIAETDVSGTTPGRSQVTVSLGIATTVPADGERRASLILRADSMLYEAKRDGRNRVRSDGGRLGGLDGPRGTEPVRRVA